MSSFKNYYGEKYFENLRPNLLLLKTIWNTNPPPPPPTPNKDFGLKSCIVKLNQRKFHNIDIYLHFFEIRWTTNRNKRITLNVWKFDF